MLFDAYQARDRAGLSERELETIAELCAKEGAQNKASTVTAQRLRLLDCDLQQIVVIDESHNDGRLLLYVPGDPNGAWARSPAFASSPTNWVGAYAARRTRHSFAASCADATVMRSIQS